MAYNRKSRVARVCFLPVIAVALAIALNGCGEKSITDSDTPPLVRDTLPVTRDARVSSSLFSTPLGSSGQLLVGTVVYAGGPTVVDQSIVGLPPLPLPLDSISLSSATLVLHYLNSLDTLAFPVTAFRVISTWDEDSVTWLTRPSIDSTALTTTANHNQQLRFDITPLYVDSTFANGVLLGTDAAGIFLCSREYGIVSERPVVEVLYRLR